MAECNQIGLMLGAFEDHALEPNEYQEVAYHLARCDSCTAELADYGMIGRELRTLFEEPSLDGFKSSVMRRIDSLPVPLGLRISRWFSRAGEQLSGSLAMAGAAAAAAVVTAILVTPYAQTLRHSGYDLASLERATISAPMAVASVAAGPAELADVADDSHAVISRLESEIPSVAVWSEPKTDTTVIWLPDQP
ncbi:MAG TPA: zf-HC2 domain-containing protein [Candidatus Binataceae bacterium]|nr:zf-HC2 domain-containing protein [Candidatus Binataceae bacterium]HVA68068.1 zf-HC2 domain-containing protein [Candidatus Binataceae bacterium]